jgi:hypothetical protein
VATVEHCRQHFPDDPQISGDVQGCGGAATFAREDVKLANRVVHKAGSGHATFLLSNYDFGEGEIDFSTLTRILERRQYKGWICLDQHSARVSPRYNYGRCMEYIKNTLGPIYS